MVLVLLPARARVLRVLRVDARLARARVARRRRPLPAQVPQVRERGAELAQLVRLRQARAVAAAVLVAVAADRPGRAFRRK